MLAFLIEQNCLHLQDYINLQYYWCFYTKVIILLLKQLIPILLTLLLYKHFPFFTSFTAIALGFPTHKCIATKTRQQIYLKFDFQNLSLKVTAALWIRLILNMYICITKANTVIDIQLLKTYITNAHDDIKQL